MIKDLEVAIGYHFSNITLLQRALSHASYANERWHDGLLSNERLEFLGDSVLGMVVAEHLYTTFPDRLEGDLTRIRADMVCERALAQVAEKIELGKHLLLGHGEELSGGRTRASIMADAVEAVIAACFLDGGMEQAKTLIHRLIISDTEPKKPGNADYKTALQELIQRKRNQKLSYILKGQSGPDHDKQFCVEVMLNGKTVGSGVGSSKKRAEQNAAKQAITALFPSK